MEPELRKVNGCVTTEVKEGVPSILRDNELPQPFLPVPAELYEPLQRFNICKDRMDVE